MKRESKEIESLPICEENVFRAFYEYSLLADVLDYDYFVKVYLPRFLGILSVEQYKELGAYVEEHTELFTIIKSSCECSMYHGAKQNTIQFIKEFGGNRGDKVIINIVGDAADDEENDNKT